MCDNCNCNCNCDNNKDSEQKPPADSSEFLETEKPDSSTNSEDESK